MRPFPGMRFTPRTLHVTPHHERFGLPLVVDGQRFGSIREALEFADRWFEQGPLSVVLIAPFHRESGLIISRPDVTISGASPTCVLEAEIICSAPRLSLASATFQAIAGRPLVWMKEPCSLLMHNVTATSDSGDGIVAAQGGTITLRGTELTADDNAIVAPGDDPSGLTNPVLHVIASHSRVRARLGDCIRTEREARVEVRWSEIVAGKRGIYSGSLPALPSYWPLPTARRLGPLTLTLLHSILRCGETGVAASSIATAPELRHNYFDAPTPLALPATPEARRSGNTFGSGASVADDLSARRILADELVAAKITATETIRFPESPPAVPN